MKLRESTSSRMNRSPDLSPEVKSKSIAEIYQTAPRIAFEYDGAGARTVRFVAADEGARLDEQAVVRKKDGRGRKKAENVSYEFEVGDLVWGKITSHPWWPGVVYDPAFASEEALRVKKEGQMAVFLYGDNCHGWIKPSMMLPFEEHFAAKAGKTDNKCTIKGVELALEEVKRRSVLGFVCNCHHGSSLQKASFVEQDLYRVEFGGFIDGGVYSEGQMQKAREAVQPVEMLSFLQQLAANARNGCPESSDRISMTRNTSQLQYYRNYVRRHRDQDERAGFPEAEEQAASMDFVWGSALKLKRRVRNVEDDLNQQDVSLGFPEVEAQEPADEPITRFVWGNSLFPKGRRQRRRPRKLRAPTPGGNAAERISSDDVQVSMIGSSSSSSEPRVAGSIGGSTNNLPVSVTGGGYGSPETVAEEPPREESERRVTCYRREPPQVQSMNSQPQASTSGGDPERRQRLLDILKKLDEIKEAIKNLGS